VSLEINPTEIDFDPEIARWVAEYKRLKLEAAQIAEQVDIARSHIEAALGHHEIGTVNGQPVVRWAIVESERIDVKKLREILPQQALDVVTKRSLSRRFTVLTGNETY
jgi:predicted phage-related endonuclease